MESTSSEEGFTTITHSKCTVTTSSWDTDDENVSHIKIDGNFADDEDSIYDDSIKSLSSRIPIEEVQVYDINNIPESEPPPAFTFEEANLYLDNKLIHQGHPTTSVLPNFESKQSNFVYSEPKVTVAFEKEPLISTSEMGEQHILTSGIEPRVEMAKSASQYSFPSILVHDPATIDALSLSSENLREQITPDPLEPASQKDIYELLRDIKDRYSRLPFSQNRYFGLAFLLVAFLIFPFFISGFLFGVYACMTLFMLYYVSDPIPPITDDPLWKQKKVEQLRKESIKEDCIQRTYRGWMNILNEPYHISTFHYNEIQPVIVRLEGNMLRISRPEKNMLKHAFHEDPTFANENPIIISESLYDLTNASVKLRPKELARNRWFSRRYPICIKLSTPDSEIHSRNEERFLKLQQEVLEGDHKKGHNPIKKVKKMLKKRKERKRRSSSISSMDSDDYAPKRAVKYMRQESAIETGYNTDGFYEDEFDNMSIASSESLVGLRRSLSEGNLVSSPLNRLQRSFPGPNSSASRNIYLFARTAREKERWFHVLRKASTKYSTSSKALTTIERPISPSVKPFLPTMTFNQDYYLYLLKEMEFNRLLNNILTNVSDNRSETSGTLNSSLRSEANKLVIMDLGRQFWNQPAHSSSSDLVVIANLLTTRIFYDLSKDYGWIDLIRKKVQTKIATLHLPHFMDELVLTNIDMGTAVPKITKMYSPSVDEWGIWLDVEILYEGSMKMTMETHCDLMKLQSTPDPTLTAPSTDGLHASRMLSMRNTPNAYDDEDIPLSPEMSPDEDFGTKIEVKSKKKTGKKRARKLIGIVDRMAHSKLAKKITEIKQVRKTIEKISDKTITINVDVNYVSGTLAVNIPSPPSDRIWYGFRSPPEMKIKTVPQIGDRTIDFTKLSDFMESNVKLILAKHIVLPNMDDLVIPTITGDPLLRGPINM